jgi:hypothetical protein
MWDSLANSRFMVIIMLILGMEVNKGCVYYTVIQFGLRIGGGESSEKSVVYSVSRERSLVNEFLT